MQKTSWGLMQIMGAVAREHGFSGWLPELVDPELNIEIGVKHLKKLFARFGEKFGVDGVIAAYNKGTPVYNGETDKKDKTDKKFVNQGYVDKVKEYMKMYSPLMNEEGGPKKTSAAKPAKAAAKNAQEGPDNKQEVSE